MSLKKYKFHLDIFLIESRHTNHSFAFFCSKKQHGQKQFGEKMVHFILKMTVTEGSRNLKQKLKRTSSYWLAPTLSYHSYRVLHSYILHRDRIAHGGWGPPTPISKQTHVPKICPEDNLIEAILHLRFPLPHVKLKANISCHTFT